MELLARGAGELGDAQGVQVVGRSYSMGLKGIAGAGAVVRHGDPVDSGGVSGSGAQSGAAEDVGATIGANTIGIEVGKREPPKPDNWGTMTRSQRRNWFKRKLGRENA